MDGVGNKPGWAWIFILVSPSLRPLIAHHANVYQEGLFTVLSGLGLFFVMPRTPSHVRFFTGEEKRYVLRYLRQDGVLAHEATERAWDARGGEDPNKVQWTEVLRTMARPQVVLLVLAGFFNGATLFGLA